MQLLSVIITCYNEADNLMPLLESIQWADEVIIVDSFSTDNTLEIIKRFKVTLFQRAYKGPADQKNWAIPKAKNEWVLILDADERIPNKLQKEILKTIENPSKFDAFWIGRTSFFMGKKIRYSGWQRDKVIRLIKRDKCRYNNKQVHEEIDTTQITVGFLKEKMEHYTFKNMEHFLDKTQRYARWSAKDHASKTLKVTPFHLFLKPLFRFFKHYILQRGFLDGKQGLIISVLMAWGVFLRYAYLLEYSKK